MGRRPPVRTKPPGCRLKLLREGKPALQSQAGEMGEREGMELEEGARGASVLRARATSPRKQGLVAEVQDFPAASTPAGAERGSRVGKPQPGLSGPLDHRLSSRRPGSGSDVFNQRKYSESVPTMPF